MIKLNSHDGFLSYSKALICTFFRELKSSCNSKSCIVRSVLCNTVFKNKKIRVVEGQYFITGVRVPQVHTVCKNVQKRAKMCISSTY